MNHTHAMPHIHIRLHRSTRERFVIAFVSLALILVGVGLLAVLPACESKQPAANNRGPAAATYTVRGQIETLPASSSGDLSIHHEAIPDFKDKDGKVADNGHGMASMSMPFPLAEGVKTEGLAVGDMVEFEFAVWWNPVAYRVTRLVKLPADTKLNFGPAPAPAPAPPAHQHGNP